MSLTDTAIRSAKPREKSYKLYDEKGLYLQVNPNGSKLWRLRYRSANKDVNRRWTLTRWVSSARRFALSEGLVRRT